MAKMRKSLVRLDHAEAAEDSGWPKAWIAAQEEARRAVATGASPHLTDDLIAAYLERTLPPRTYDRVMDHLFGCPDCAARNRAAFVARRALWWVEVDGRQVVASDASDGDSSARPRTRVTMGPDQTRLVATCGRTRLVATLTPALAGLRWLLRIESPSLVQVWAAEPRRFRPQWAVLEEEQEPTWVLRSGEYEIRVGDADDTVVWRVSLILDNAVEDV